MIEKVLAEIERVMAYVDAPGPPGTTVPTRVTGWCSRKKAAELARAVVERQPRVVVEIGVWGGASLVPLALACKLTRVGHVHGIDPWSPAESIRHAVDPDNREWWGQKVNYEDRVREVLSALVDLGLTPWCSVHRTTSEHAAVMFSQIDLLHVDGNHTEESSTRDIELYLPKVPSGGTVFFDDVDWQEGGKFTTRRALEIVESQCDRIGEVVSGNTCAIYRKR